MNSQELAEMFKNLQVGNVFSYRCPACNNDHGLLVMEIHPSYQYQFAIIENGEIDDIVPYLLKWDAEKQVLKEMGKNDAYIFPLRPESIKLETQSFPEKATLLAALEFYRRAHTETDLLMFGGANVMSSAMANTKH